MMIVGMLLRGMSQGCRYEDCRYAVKKYDVTKLL